MPAIDEQPEPDEMEPVPVGRELRSGFTTGTSAAAAAVAAGLMLAGKSRPEQVTVMLPGGGEITVAVAESSILNSDEAMAVVVKDGGDDPDVTNGAKIGAIVRRLSKNGQVRIIGGVGVGRVTKAGLALPPGQWAINPTPRRMLAENLAPLFQAGLFPGAEVEIFVENGEELAPRTLNPRLGIIGGISILGTSGLVKPFSHEAYIATVESALDVARAAGLAEVVFATGRQSEKAVMPTRPDLKPESFIQIADFFGDSLKLASARGFQTIGLAVFFGKAVKQARGLANTHARRHEQEAAILADWLGEADESMAAQLREAMTARAALEILRERGRMDLTHRVARKALTAARNFVGPGPRLWMTIFDYDGTAMVSDQLAE